MTRGIIVGAFDLLHSGHLFTLRKAKKHCDRLIVGLQVNPKTERPDKNKPIESMLERFNRLQACRYVDGVIPYETEEDVLNLLATGDFDFRFNGEDHEDKPMPSERDEMCERMGIETIYVGRKHNWSTTRLRGRIEIRGRIERG